MNEINGQKVIVLKNTSEESFKNSKMNYMSTGPQYSIDNNV